MFYLNIPKIYMDLSYLEKDNNFYYYKNVKDKLLYLFHLFKKFFHHNKHIF